MTAPGKSPRDDLAKRVIWLTVLLAVTWLVVSTGVAWQEAATTAQQVEAIDLRGLTPVSPPEGARWDRSLNILAAGLAAILPAAGIIVFGLIVAALVQEASLSKRSFYVGAATLSIASLLYPPWIVRAPNGVVVEQGYALLFEGISIGRAQGEIDITRLGIQLIIIAILLGIGLKILARD